MFKLSMAVPVIFLSGISVPAQTRDKEDSEIKAVRHVAQRLTDRSGSELQAQGAGDHQGALILFTRSDEGRP